MVESPDVPWARDHDPRGAPPALPKTPDLAVSFASYLEGKKVKSGRMLVIGSNKESCASAAHFARAGFDVHLVGESDPYIANLDLYGVHLYTQSLNQHWLFDDGYFDLALNFLSLTAKSQLLRVLKDGAYYYSDGKIRKN